MSELSRVIDLNPIRAKLAKTPEQSDHTSIKYRIKNLTENQQSNLFPFVGNPRQDMPEGLPFHLKDYIELVDMTGRIIREGKRGFISAKAPPILSRLNIEPENWIYLAKHFESKFKGLVGSVLSLKAACKKLGYKRNNFLKNCEHFFT